MATAAKTLDEHLRLQAQATPDAGALWFEHRVTPYAELDRRANQVANGLTRLGLKPGARIAYLGKNSDCFFEILFGAARAGLVTVPVNWRLAAPELLAVLTDSTAGTLFVGAEFIDAAGTIVQQLPGIARVYVLEAPVGNALRSDWTAYPGWRDTQSDSPPDSAPGHVDDAVLQIYTSGTTGLPKGAVLTHRSLLAIRDERHAPLPDWNTWRSDDVSLVAMPVFHIAGAGTGLTAICSGSGALSVVMREFNAQEVLDHLQRDWLTKMFLVPAVLHVLTNHPRTAGLDCRKLRYVFYGASPMPFDLLERSMSLFPSAGFAQFYGLTEASGYVVVLSPDDHSSGDPRRLRSAGRPLSGVELKIVDEQGAAVRIGTVGEILIRSEANMPGYWNQVEATAVTIDAAGWLHTGDAGYLDQDGYLFIYDRVKDMVVSGGENIYPAEVENAIYGYPGIADVAVIGVPDPTWGEAVKALIVPEAGRALDRQAIIDWARARIAGYKVPKSIEFVESLPRNASGKVLRRVLRERYWIGSDRRVN